MNQRTIEAQNKLLNSANESNLIYQYLGGGERTTELKDEFEASLKEVDKVCEDELKKEFKDEENDVDGSSCHFIHFYCL